MAGKILLVDDEPAIREMIGFSLSHAGFAYSEAGDAAQAEAEIMREQPDLILLDWMLPGQSGIDFARRLRRDKATRSIPIIMVTARGDEEDRVRGLNLGADEMGRQRDILNTVADMVESGQIRSTLTRCLGPLNTTNAAMAHEILQSRTVIAKLIMIEVS